MSFLSRDAKTTGISTMQKAAAAIIKIESGLALARCLHILGSYWGFLFINLHLGLHWNMIIHRLKRRKKSFPHSISAACFTVALAIVLYGVWGFIKRDFPTYLFLKSEFVFLLFIEGCPTHETIYKVLCRKTPMHYVNYFMVEW